MDFGFSIGGDSSVIKNALTSRHCFSQQLGYIDKSVYLGRNLGLLILTSMQIVLLVPEFSKLQAWIILPSLLLLHRLFCHFCCFSYFVFTIFSIMQFFLPLHLCQLDCNCFYQVSSDRIGDLYYALKVIFPSVKSYRNKQFYITFVVFGLGVGALYNVLFQFIVVRIYFKRKS